jgi:HNH/ENDO VII superfamily nuclease with conserved GHE residues
VLGFGKDIVMGIGELAYEGIKAVPKLGRMAYTSNGQAISQLNGAILAENISLGNITAGTVGQGALDIGSAIIKPITDPWNKGQYVEAVTRGAAEIATLPIAWTKAQKAAQATKAKTALEAAEAAKAKAALEAEEAVKAKAALDAEEAAKAGDGVHVKAKPYADPKSRPKYAEGQVDDVWDQARRDSPDGVVRDPNTGEALTWDKSKSRAGQWDMGHLPGQEYRNLHSRYMSGEISLDEFLVEYRNPANYKPESISGNRSHRYEGP